MRPWAHPVTHENPASFAFRFTQQETGNPKPETLFSEQMPAFPGGRKAMKAAISYRSTVIMCAAIFAGIVSLAGRGMPPDPDLSELSRSFANPPDDSRIMMRWWWFGPAVTNAELEREMKLMKEGGIGGFEVQPVYPVALDDPAAGIRNVPYLSDEFLESLRFTADKAHELGLRMDLTLGSGWPFGGAQVPIQDAAGKLRIVRTRISAGARNLPLPKIGLGEKLLAIFLHTQNSAEEPRELTEIKDEAVIIPANEASQEAIFFISSHTGMKVKRAAVGAEGFVLNHYDRGAVEGYLKNVGDRLMQALRPSSPYSIFCDSLEVYESDWTGDFLEEFQKRRGYDLKPHLPALVLDLGPRTASVRYDWGKTLTELFNERFMVPVHAWSQKNHARFRIQGYGIPPATVASNAHADLAEGEGSQWKTLSATRWASSASHLFGRAVTSSETWTWLHSPVFRATPLDMKAEADRHFLQGVNQLIGHGWPYSPENAEYPGWRFYAAGAFNEKNPWWIVMPDITRYLQRCSYLLRQGRPANDVAFYLPVSDAYAAFSPGRVNLIEGLRNRIGPDAVEAVLDAGWNFDFFDDDVLKQIGKVEKGALVLSPNRYRAVVLPNVERIPLETLKMFDQFVRSGGVVIASKRLPESAPGFMTGGSDNAEIRRISRNLFSSSAKRSQFIANEKTLLAGALRNMLQPDVKFSPEAPEMGFVHRTTENAEIYFLANTSNAPIKTEASFRVIGMKAEWWDPMSGKIIPAAVSFKRKDRTAVALDLEPYGSLFLVFSKRAGRAPVAAMPSAPASIDLSEGWRISIGTVVKTMERLSSWTDDDATRNFSGVAVYEKSISVPANMLKRGVALWLDFGDVRALTETSGRSNGMQAWFEGPVREAAVVYINEKRAGSVWCPPYRVEVTGSLKVGENKIRIQVANTAINNMAGKPLPDYRQLNQRYGVRFEPQDMDKIKPVASGLLGPIRLLAEPANTNQ
jgi:hypothetical protein